MKYLKQFVLIYLILFVIFIPLTIGLLPLILFSITKSINWLWWLFLSIPIVGMLYESIFNGEILDWLNDKVDYLNDKK